MSPSVLVSTSVDDVWVVDASPLIGLAKVGRLDLLTAPNRRVLVAQTVADEVGAGSEDDPARAALAGGWGERLPVPPVPPVLAVRNLDAGEEATLTLALSLPGSLSSWMTAMGAGPRVLSAFLSLARAASSYGGVRRGCFCRPHMTCRCSWNRSGRIGFDDGHPTDTV